jgi:enediyne biosynthesis protein E4
MGLGARSRRRRLCLSIFVAGAVLAGGCSEQIPSRAAQRSDPPPLFEEIQRQVGLDFVHDPGTPGTWFYPEIMVMGAAFLDYDCDGDLDIYLLNCGEPPMSGVARDPARARNRLFRQEAGGRFIDATEQSGLGDEGYSMAVAVGDINNDGFPDVYVANYGKDAVYLNERNGHFREIADEAGVVHERWSGGACFLDYDRDGWLDLYVANYVDYFPSRKCYGASGRPDYCGPASFEKSVDRLFRNVTGELQSRPSGDSAAANVRFVDVTVPAGIARRAASGLGVVALDFNDDGWQDIYVANDMMANILWINQRDGTFRDEALSRGAAYDSLGRPAANMGVACSDLNDDQVPDIYVTHMAGEMNVLYMSEGTIGYREAAVQAGLAASMHSFTTFGAVLLDIDHDGDDDAAMVHGAMKLPDTAVNIPAYADREAYWRIFAEPNMIFLNDGNNVFHAQESSREIFCQRREVSRGLCMGDIDNDGDLDLLVANTAAPVRLYRNVAAKTGSWLRVRAVEPAWGGRDSYGARITVYGGGRRWTRWISPSGSYLSSHDAIAHFGLGSIATIDHIDVRWASGDEETFAGGPVNQLRVLAHGSATAPTAVAAQPSAHPRGEAGPPGAAP